MAGYESNNYLEASAVIGNLIDWKTGIISNLDQNIENVEDLNILPEYRGLNALGTRVKQLRGEDYGLLDLQSFIKREERHPEAPQPLIFDPNYISTQVNNPNFGSAGMARADAPFGTSILIATSAPPTPNY